MTQSPELISVAYHEAGHAVMAALSPYHEVGETVLAVEDLKVTTSNGRSHFLRLKDNDLWEFRIVVAGGAGEKLLDPNLDPWDVENLFAFKPSAAQLDIITSGFTMDIDDDVDPEKYCRREQRKIRAACELLKKHAVAVHEVAKVLRTRGRISGAEVQTIAGPVRKVRSTREPKS